MYKFHNQKRIHRRIYFKISGHICEKINLMSTLFFAQKWPLILKFCAKYQQKIQTFVEHFLGKNITNPRKRHLYRTLRPIYVQLYCTLKNLILKLKASFIMVNHYYVTNTCSTKSTSHYSLLFTYHNLNILLKFRSKNDFQKKTREFL